MLLKRVRTTVPHGEIWFVLSVRCVASAKAAQKGDKLCICDMVPLDLTTTTLNRPLDGVQDACQPIKLHSG